MKTMQTILEAWTTYKNEVIPADAPAVQVIETRRGFYAGAIAMAHNIIVGSATTKSQPEFEARMKAIFEEGQDFANRVGKDC
jgi:hypothetical protein